MLIREYIQYDAYELAALIKSRQISAQEALTCALTRIDEVNPVLNAVVTDCSEFANNCLSEMKGNEPFYGVPLLVKDLGHALQGIRMTEGSRFFADNLAKKNSDLVSKLIAMGFIPIAKTNTPELGLSYVTESLLLGPCRNPFEPGRTPGGSSGGSAAAVAAGIAPVATASDGGGSIRIPAACCGLFGFKPTTGLTPTGPWVGELWSGMATNFVLTRTVRDSTLIFNHLMKQNLDYPLSREKKSLNIAILEGAFAQVPVATECLNAVKNMEEILKSAGHQVVQKQLPLDLDLIGSSAMILIAANTCAAIKAREQETGLSVQVHDVEPVTWEFYQRGLTISAYELILAKNRLYQALNPLHEFLEHHDMVLTPALAQLPLLIGQLRTDDQFDSYLQKNINFSPFTSLFNQAGLPAMTVPVIWHEELPVSVQIGAAKGADLLLLSLAHELEAVIPKFTPKLNLI
ncbi:amidase [Legionella shakespearei]|uniref:Amidase n=1 Tax=Legionella shakespearei DSM 23087 TaxID=1122169 RepID=A0A0W0YLT3_9GAMM|nr:amidase family protein [Legionella shakespearei]KTD57494.1 amidase [Legionella shakespearei DSM 23087]